MENLDVYKSRFLDLYGRTCPPQKEIAVALKIGLDDVRRLFIEYDSELKEMMDAKKIWNSKNAKYGVSEDFLTFFNWYKNLERKCCYCGVEEKVVSELFTHLLKSKRKRGLSLELERFEPNEPYSEENCALACYVCNNNKSDFMSAQEFRIFFAESTRRYLKAKYAELQIRK